MTREHYRTRFTAIEQLHRSGSYFACVRECGALFEVAFRQILGQVAAHPEKSGNQMSVPEALAKLHNNARPTLGSFVECVSDDEVQKQLRIHFKSSLPRLRRISWKGITAIRNEAVHDESHSTIDSEDSVQMKWWLQIFLTETRLLGKAAPTRGKPAERSDACADCKSRLADDWKFCPYCGACSFLTCVSCGNALDAKFKICPYCETPIRGTSRANAKAIHEFELLFKGAFLDSILTGDEEELLELKRLELGLPPDVADDVRNRCIPSQLRQYQQLVEAAYADGGVNEAERTLLHTKARQLGIAPKIAAAIEASVKGPEGVRQLADWHVPAAAPVG